jgi:hypothetical protein
MNANAAPDICIDVPAVGVQSPSYVPACDLHCAQEHLEETLQYLSIQTPL